MPTARKEATVAELKALVETATIVIGAEYRGLSREGDDDAAARAA